MIAFENILSGLQSTGVFILVLSILIVVHEWGHFITAKKLGVRVDEFALGFGPTLWSKFYNGTNYMLKAFPLGGYVRMAGDERDKCTGSPDEFYSKSVGARALIVLNGPVVNFVLAYLSFVLVFMIGYPGLSTEIAEIKTGSSAQVAGVEVGDRIVAVNDKKVYGWMHYDRLLEGTSLEPVTLEVERDGRNLLFELQPEITQRPNLLGQPRDFRSIGLNFHPNVIGGVVEDFPADKAGLMAGDKIIEIDKVPITNWTMLQENILHSQNDTIVLKVQRDGQVLTKMVEPNIDMVRDEQGNEVQERKIGIGPQQEFMMFKFNILDSFGYAAEELTYITVLTYESLFRMVTGSLSAKKSVTGPVGIFYIVKGAAEAGISHLLFILGVISASLAIFNLLPMVPLDGGHLFLMGIEKIRGAALPVKVDDFIARLGFSLIICLALFVFYSDFARFGWIDGVVGFVKSVF